MVKITKLKLNNLWHPYKLANIARTQARWGMPKTVHGGLRVPGMKNLVNVIIRVPWACTSSRLDCHLNLLKAHLAAYKNVRLLKDLFVATSLDWWYQSRVWLRILGLPPMQRPCLQMLRQPVLTSLQPGLLEMGGERGGGPSLDYGGTQGSLMPTTFSWW